MTISHARAMAYPAIKVKEVKRAPEGIVRGSQQFSSELSTRVVAGNRPKLLFLACGFPPVQAIASVRTWNMAKYLARSGWDVTVITPHPSLWRNVENPQIVAAELEREGIRRIPTGHQLRFLFCSPNPLICWDRGVGWFVGGIFRRMARYFEIDDLGIGWIRAAERACSTLTAKDVDIILASGPPFASFMLARRLSNRLGCPYALDYRDPWMRSTRGRLLSQLRLLPEEIELVTGSSAVTIVSNSLLDGKLNIGSKLHVITNGFDPEEMAQVKPFDFGHFAIVYTGAFYIPERVITPVMRALRRLKETDIDKSVKWRFHYYGAQNDYVSAEAARFDLIDRVVLHGRVSRTEALSAVRGAGVAVVITSIFDDASREDKGIVTGKLFEPLGLGTPILLIAPPGSDATQIVEETGMGRGFVGTDIEGIVRFLSNIAQTEPNQRSSCTDRYSWPLLAARLDRILRGVIVPRQGDVLPKSQSSIGHKKQVLS